MAKYWQLSATLAAVALAACQPDQGITTPGTELNALLNVGQDSPGAVYTLTNQVSGNAVAVFKRDAGGSLVADGIVSTGGTGTGGGLGSQGALVLSQDGGHLFAVNAGSNDVSAFRVDPSGLTLTSRVPSGGIQPTSLTVHGNLLYVLNAGSDGNISGFTIGQNGQLAPLAGSTRPLSGTATRPAQVSFSPNGKWLIVTERATNLIGVYAVNSAGLASGPVTYPSAGTTPFGFAFGHRNQLFVSEAGGSASSYNFSADGHLTVISAAVATNQGAPCWLVVTKNGRYTYTANAQGGTISGFSITPSGAIASLDPDGATAVVGAGATDAALSGNGRFLYQLVRSDVLAFRIQADGSLTPEGSVGGLPAGTVGLAAR
ncbi:MAG: lactonase family protein [Gemmatimonadaceae bacterium]